MFWFVLVRVTSWIVLSFLDKRNDPRASHELNTKLVTTEIDFEQSYLGIDLNHILATCQLLFAFERLRFSSED